ncbi:MAG TPA: N-acetyltransferase [Chloroflexi bacterium]|nr:N-acetyltransferase [Chloroflexota bacterium]
MTEPFIIPSLITERLLLRAFEKDDLDPFASMVSDLEVMQRATYDGTTMNRIQAWNWLCFMLGHWYMRGFGIWGIEEKTSGELIGRIGLQFWDSFDDVELVWMLAKSAWGKGFASEGARAAIDFGLNTLAIPRIAAVIPQENKPSIRLAERLGMEMEKEVERQDTQFYQYVIAKD